MQKDACLTSAELAEDELHMDHRDRCVHMHGFVGPDAMHFMTCDSINSFKRRLELCSEILGCCQSWLLLLPDWLACQKRMW